MSDNNYVTFWELVAGLLIAAWLVAMCGHYIACATSTCAAGKRPHMVEYVCMCVEPPK